MQIMNGPYRKVLAKNTRSKHGQLLKLLAPVICVLNSEHICKMGENGHLFYTSKCARQTDIEQMLNM